MNLHHDIYFRNAYSSQKHIFLFADALNCHVIIEVIKIVGKVLGEIGRKTVSTWDKTYKKTRCYAKYEKKAKSSS